MEDLDAIEPIFFWGDKRSPHTIPFSYLVRYSRVFRTFWENNLALAKDYEFVWHIPALTNDCTLLRVIFLWMETGEFPTEAFSSQPEHRPVGSWIHYFHHDLGNTNALVYMYIFAEIYEIDLLRKDAIDELFDLLVTCAPDAFDFPSPETLKDAFKHLKADSLLCKFLVDAAVHRFDNVLMETYVKSGLPSEFKDGMLLRYSSSICEEIEIADENGAMGYLETELNPKHLVLCDYHGHTTE